MIDSTNPFPKANGVLIMEMSNMPWWGSWLVRDLTIYGGPFVRGYAATPRTWGLCLVERISEDQPHDEHMPIADYSVPTDEPERVRQVIRAVVYAAAQGKHVYVGCLGGWGRTGLMLSLIAKTFDIPDPVGFVRRNYTPSAVETDEQEDFVAGFEPPKITPYEVFVEALAGRTFFGNHLRAWGLL